MRRARGLTLLETVIAAALLAVLGATGASLLVDARQRIDRPAPKVSVHDLSMLAAALVNDPSGVGLGASIADVGERTTLQWPDAFEAPGAPAVTLRFVASKGFAATGEDQERAARRAWLVLECAGVTTARWVELPDEEDAP